MEVLAGGALAFRTGPVLNARVSASAPSSRRGDAVARIPDAAGSYERIHAVVRRIPRGRVSTYGAIARAAGAGGARQVGYAMHALGPSSTVPWHRVVNAQGHVSLPGSAGALQRARLLAEGIVGDARGRIDLVRYGWVAPQ